MTRVYTCLMRVKNLARLIIETREVYAGLKCLLFKLFLLNLTVLCKLILQNISNVLISKAVIK